MAFVGVSLTGNQLTLLGALSARHVGFSLTEACPLKCRHCIVSTVSAAVRSRTMPMERAKQYAGQLPALTERGVQFISFTGGEPLLAPKQLQLLSEAAVCAGLECTVVTACHWATSDSATRRVIAAFPNIASWHLSTDVFHEEFVPLHNVLRAARVAVAESRRVMVRMAATVPLSERHQQMHQELQAQLPDGAPIVVQPITQMGRGASIQTEIPLAEVPAWPCVPSAMVVRFDGTVSPCCGGLSDERTGHPFQYPAADRVGLAQAHQAWCTDPLLQLIRTVGFAPLLQWVAEAFPEHEVLKATPRHPCECCIKLWKDPAVGPELRRRAELPQNRLKIARLTGVVFGETFMKQAEAALSAPAASTCGGTHYV
ncbi:MAG: radical SAM protein [Acidobacteria bacterium]|nr:radical SAM protein [Acidobacteriota bacterium]